MKFNSVQSMFSLSGKTAIITGAGGYFGRAFSECMLISGAKVILYGRGNKINELASQLKEKYGNNKIDKCIVDFYDEENFKKCLTHTIQQNETVDILVNNSFEFSKNTGFNDPSGRLENISKLQWMHSFESGIYWHALAIQIVAEKMRQQGGGSIINISSMYAIVSPDPELYVGVDVFNPPSYGAVKAGLLALTRYVASFYGKDNVRCNAIVAGPFPNLSTESYNRPKNGNFLKKLCKKTALNRTGEVDELLGALIFLASDASSYVTGQNIIVDGGWTVR